MERSEHHLVAEPRCHRDAGVAVALGGDGTGIERSVGEGRERAGEYGGSEHLRELGEQQETGQRSWGRGVGKRPYQCRVRNGAEKSPP